MSQIVFFFLTGQEKSGVYSSHSYNTSLSPPAASPPTQENVGGLHKNGDPNMPEHSVVNFPAASTSDTITIHTGRSPESLLVPASVTY